MKIVRHLTANRRIWVGPFWAVATWKRTSVVKSASRLSSPLNPGRSKSYRTLKSDYLNFGPKILLPNDTYRKFGQYNFHLKLEWCDLVTDIVSSYEDLLSFIVLVHFWTGSKTSVDYGYGTLLNQLYTSNRKKYLTLMIITKNFDFRVETFSSFLLHFWDLIKKSDIVCNQSPWGLISISSYF